MTCRCLLIYYRYMRVEPVSFGKEHKEMLVHAKMLLEQGYIAINPVFDKLITSLRTAIAEENILDKESTSYADIFDAYRLALNHYQFAARGNMRSAHLDNARQVVRLVSIITTRRILQVSSVFEK
jgi:hypothetical protein